MRTDLLIILLFVSVSSYSCIRTNRWTSLTPTARAQEVVAVSTTSLRIHYATQVEPLLRSKCHGCHFSGGKMYDKLPFDRPETIKRLGTKLFTRIHDENDRKLIREFLSQE
jgi:hypothetical protein